MHRYGLAVFLALASSILPWSAARAFVPVPRPMPCMLYFLSDTVFVGEVTATKELEGTGEDAGSVEGWDYTLKVIRSYRGAETPTILVHTENDSSRFPLEVGKRYLLFASNEDGKLTISYDMLSGELKDSKQALGLLDKIMARKSGEGGDVFGRVTLQSFGSDSGGVQGVHVTVQGSAGGAEGVTNKNGWFKVHLPAGTYSATASDRRWKFHPQDISWESPDSFQVPDGGCAEIQIQAEPVRP